VPAMDRRKERSLARRRDRPEVRLSVAIQPRAMAAAQPLDRFGSAVSTRSVFRAWAVRRLPAVA
jgi:hypothetical protein